MPDPQIYPLPNEPSLRDTERVYEQVRVDHKRILEDLLTSIKDEAGTIDEMIRQLREIERSIEDAKLNLTVSQETLLWAVTDAFKRIRQGLDEALARFFGVPVEQIHRKVEVVGDRRAFSVTIGEP